MEQIRHIEIDVKKSIGKVPESPLFCVSAARANLLLRSDHQQHLKRAVQECGFQYLRFHGIFQDDMGAYREDAFGAPVYSWQYVDQVYDFLLGIGIRPFVVFDFMPSALASGETTVYWEKANVTLPNSYEKWQNLITAATEHFTLRYGREEIKKWYFEVWNEPDNAPFFSGTFEDYCKLYDVTARAVKAVCEDYRVGGPAISGNVEWVSGLIQYCSQNTVPLDFISAHSYSTKGFCEDGTHLPALPGIPAWEPGPSWELGNQCYDPEGVLPAVLAVRKAISESAMPHLELHYTEWGLTWDYWDSLRDSYHAASYILSRINAVSELVDSLSYCEISDVFEEDGPPSDSFHGGFGLLNLQGIRKPAYFAYWFLSQLGTERIFCTDSNCIAAKKGNAYQVLVWNDAAHQDQENKRYYDHEVAPCTAGRLQVAVSGLAPGNYLMKGYSAGYQKNDAYTMYLRMKKQESLSKEQVELLDSVSSGQPFQISFFSCDEEGGATVVLDTLERENDVYLLSIIPY